MITYPMELCQARRYAKKYSEQYGTFWYVRKVPFGKQGDWEYKPYAHDSGDEFTVATFLNGREEVFK